MNVLADSLAKAYWNQTNGQSLQPPFYVEDPQSWTVWHGSRRLSQWNRKVLESLCQGPQLERHWVDSGRIPASLISSIDWVNCGSAIRELGLHQQLAIPKWASRTLPTQSLLHRRGQVTSPTCLQCDAPETLKHLFRCRGDGARKTWSNHFADVRQFLRRYPTAPSIRKILLARLKSLSLDRPPSNARITDPCLRNTVSVQDALGWDSLLMGLPATGWVECQQRYLDSIKSRRSGRRWLIELLRKLWAISWDLWRTRCRLKYAPDSSHTDAVHDALNFKISMEFTEGYDDWRPEDQYLFSQPLAELLQESVPVKEQWLRAVRTIRERNTRRG